MNAVGGWGGIKITLTVGETSYEVVFPKTKAYCSQPEFEPVGWEVETVNKKLIQKYTKQNALFEAFFENLDDGDEELIYQLTEIITLSQMNGIPMILYPKYQETGYSHNFAVFCTNPWHLQDLSEKCPVGQRAKGIKFRTQAPVSLSLEEPA